MTSPVPVLQAQGIVKEFRSGPSMLRGVDGVNFTVPRGERVAVVGASGSGKTTLLQVLGGLDLPTQGEVQIAGEAMTQLGEAARGELRKRAVGFVYQFHHLLPEFSALENVAMPLLIRRVPSSEAMATARALLERVGLGPRLQHRPAEGATGAHRDHDEACGAPKHKRALRPFMSSINPAFRGYEPTCRDGRADNRAWRDGPGRGAPLRCRR